MNANVFHTHAPHTLMPATQTHMHTHTNPSIFNLLYYLQQIMINISPNIKNTNVLNNVDHFMRKKAFEHSHNVQIYIILHKHKVSSGPLHSLKHSIVSNDSVWRQQRPNQTAPMPRLVWAFTVHICPKTCDICCICPKTCFPMVWPFYNIKKMDTTGRVSAIFYKDTTSVTSCLLSAHYTPSEKGSALKGRNLL